jgi:hypothetical protein
LPLYQTNKQTNKEKTQIPAYMRNFIIIFNTYMMT